MRGKKGTGGLVIAMIVIIFIVVLGLAAYLGSKEGLFSAGGGDEGEPQQNNCPDDKDTTLYIDVYNDLNETGAENFDVTGYLYQKRSGDWSYEAVIGDTTNSNGTTIDCGYDYKFCAVRTNADGGDNSVFRKVAGDASDIDSQGCILFSALESNVRISAETEQHDILNFRLFDNEDNRFAFGNLTTLGTTWLTVANTTFHDGDNTTAFAVAAGGYLDYCIQLRGPTVDEDFSDAYVLLFIDANVNAWDEPTVRYDGTLLQDISDTGLTDYEQDQWSTYEYAYRIEGDIGDTLHEVCVYLPTCSGCNPTLDVWNVFAAAGNYLSTDGRTVLQGAADDTSTNAVVFTIQEVIMDVS